MLIFVTVGTHEQQFNRLLKAVDLYSKKQEEQDNIIVQTGFSDYIPKNCISQKLFSYDAMQEHIRNADIVITHGGPASFIMALQVGKIPIVVPRQKKYDEHINDHQVEFVRLVHKRHENIIPLYDVSKLSETIDTYKISVSKMSSHIKSNNEKFNNELRTIIEKLLN